MDNLRYLFAAGVQALLALAGEACSPVIGNLPKLFPDYKDASASTVIPAWMPETRAKDGNLLMPCRMI